MRKLISFHGSQEIKDKYIARLEEHMRLDQIVQATDRAYLDDRAYRAYLDDYYSAMRSKLIDLLKCAQ